MYLIAIGDPLIGQHLAWLFLGYFVFAYTPELYLNKFGDIVTKSGFRIITAVTALCAGITMSRMFRTVPDAGVFTFFPRANFSLFIISIILVATLVFSVYVFFWREEQLFTEETSQTQGVAERLAGLDLEQKELKQLQAQSGATSKLALTFNHVWIGTIYCMPAFLLGLALAVSSSFYPLIEIIALIGFVLSRSPVSNYFDPLSDSVEFDIEAQIADSASDSTINSLGATLGLYCVLGIALSGLALASMLNTSYISLSIQSIYIQANNLFRLSGPQGILQSFSRLWFDVGLLLIPVLYVGFGLFYWLQQIKRIPSYASYFEDIRSQKKSVPSPVSTRKPPGFFLPGAALGSLFLIASELDLRLDPTGRKYLIAGFDLIWPICAIVALWSVVVSIRGDPQPITNERRDVVIALSIQLTGLSTGFVLASQIVEGAILSLSIVCFVTVSLYRYELEEHFQQYAGERDLGIFPLLIFPLFIFSILTLFNFVPQISLYLFAFVIFLAVMSRLVMRYTL